MLGDVIVFDYPRDLSKNFVKRLVGMPGDTVEMRDGILIRNGHRITEGYVEHSDQDFDSPEDEFHWQREYLVGSASSTSRCSVARWNSRP